MQVFFSISYHQWLANIVPIPKKYEMVRMYIDYRDLNKAGPKDDFYLPHINILINSTIGHEMVSFMDGYSRYNQIKMEVENREKRAFTTSWGIFCYKVLPFGLKNAKATYQRVTMSLFHDMIHKEMEFMLMK